MFLFTYHGKVGITSVSRSNMGRNSYCHVELRATIILVCPHMAIRPQDRPRRKIPMFRITCFPRSNMGRNSYCHVELRYIL